MSTLLDAGRRLAASVLPWAQREAGEVSVGLLGSFARGAPTAVSDIDLYVVTRDFPAGESSEAHAGALTLPSLTSYLLQGGADAGLVQRISLFHATESELARPTGESRHRFPMFDRWLLASGFHLPVGGFELTHRDLYQPTWQDLLEGGAGFFADTIVGKFEEAKLFDLWPRLNAAAMGRLGPVNLSKVVLVPTRLLATQVVAQRDAAGDYTRRPSAAAALLASTEQAVEGVIGTLDDAPLEALIQAAMQMRSGAPPNYDDALASLYRVELPRLYRRVRDAYEDAAPGERARLTAMRARLSSLDGG